MVAIATIFSYYDNMMIVLKRGPLMLHQCIF